MPEDADMPSTAGSGLLRDGPCGQCAKPQAECPAAWHGMQWRRHHGFIIAPLARWSAGASRPRGSSGCLRGAASA